MALRPMKMNRLFVFFSTSLIIFIHIFEMGKCSDVDQDEECFQDAMNNWFGNVDLSGPQWKRRKPLCVSPKTALVKITDYAVEQFDNGGLIYWKKSKTKKQLSGGQNLLLNYTYNGIDGLQDFNPRILRIYFDGVEVYAGINLLKGQIDVLRHNASQSWGPCQTMKSEGGSKTLTYYRYTEIKPTGKILLRWRKLDIEVIINAPLGPDYDSECALQGIWGPGSISQIRQERRVKKKKVVIHHVRRFQDQNRTSDLKMSERKAVISVDEPPTVLKFDPSTVIGPKPPYEEFPGGAVKPRNLSLWLDADDEVQMATAFLQQKRWILEYRIYQDERWTCTRVNRSKGDDDYAAILEAPFSEYHYKNRLGEFTINQDRFKIFVSNQACGCAFFTPSLSSLCLYFVAIAAGPSFIANRT